MNEFILHERLLALESIAAQYSEGKSYIPEIRNALSQLSSRLYRVAVIGEFKRGKSSLINAIIGAEVLPTDILPMTATITRVTYGNKRKILIQYKDGRSEEQTVEQLLDYATKFDEEKAKIASTIQEIVVYYPSVFCQNHIDILDTPGLNDNDQMTEVTLSVLGEVDAAIVVISAMHPMSLTEKKLILDLIERREIRHLIFVVTHIDAVRREVDQDRIIQLIRDRISCDVLEMAIEKFQADAFLTNKAKQILQNPDLFGVSSVQAIEGFVQDNWDLLEKSRFPRFKNELLAMLTSAQNMDITDKAQELMLSVEHNMESWHNADIRKLKDKEKNRKEYINRLNQYYAEAESLLNQRFIDVDHMLAERGYDPETMRQKIVTDLKQYFVMQLSTIREISNNHDTIKCALETATKKANAYVKQDIQEKVHWIKDMLMGETNAYGEIRLEQGFSGKAFAADLKMWYEKALPELTWYAPLIPEVASLKGMDVILHVDEVIEESVAAFTQELDRYISGWRVVLIQRNNLDMADRGPMDSLFESLKGIEDEILYAMRNHRANTDKIKMIQKNDVHER